MKASLLFALVLAACGPAVDDIQIDDTSVSQSLYEVEPEIDPQSCDYPYAKNKTEYTACKTCLDKSTGTKTCECSWTCGSSGSRIFMCGCVTR